MSRGLGDVYKRQVYYAEYNGHGDGYKPEKRAAYVHQLDEAQAARYTLENVMKS